MPCISASDGEEYLVNMFEQPTAHHQSIYQKLQRLYGAERAGAIYDKLLAILTPIHQGEMGELALSEKDVILIAYGDHIQDGKRPPLQVLHDFLKETVHPLINSVHLLPFFPYSSDDGFSVIDDYTVDSALGDRQHITAMGQDFRLMFDAVVNHVSQESAWFQAFLHCEAAYKDYFITVPPETDLSAVVRPRALPLLTPFETAEGTKHVWTTFSDDQIDLNYANPDVLIEVLRVLLHYVRHGAQLIRLDAIAFIWKAIGTGCIHLEETHLIIQLMRDVLNIVAPDTIIITETNVPHEENIAYFGDGSNEAQMVYQFSLPPLVFHTMTCGDTTTLTEWAASLEPVGGQTTFFNFTASHDGIGLRPAAGLLSQEEIAALVHCVTDHGGYISYKSNQDGTQSPYELNITYFDAITHPDITAKEPARAVKRFMVSQAIMLSLAGVPGIYLHNLYGSRNWHAGVQQSGRNRSINREKLNATELRAELERQGAIRQQVFDGYRKLLEVRRNEKAFHPLGKQEVWTIHPAVFAVKRRSPDELACIIALHNISREAITIELPPQSGTWYDLLSDTNWDGQTSLELAPYQICWLRRTRNSEVLSLFL